MPRSCAPCFSVFATPKKPTFATRVSVFALLVAFMLGYTSPTMAAAGGLDTPPSVLSLPLQVGGVKIMELSLPNATATTGMVTFTGPIVEQQTVISNTDGSITIGNTAASLNIAGVMNASGAINVTGSSNLNGGVNIAGQVFLSAATSSWAAGLNINNQIFLNTNGLNIDNMVALNTAGLSLNNSSGTNMIALNAANGNASFSGGVWINGGNLDIENGSNTSQLCMNGTCIKRAVPIQGDFLVISAFANAGDNWHDDESNTTAATHDMCIMTAVQHDGWDSNCNLSGAPGTPWTVSAQAGIAGSGQAAQTNCAMKCYDWR